MGKSNITKYLTGAEQLDISVVFVENNLKNRCNNSWKYLFY